jgi:uncharacterized protein YggE
MAGKSHKAESMACHIPALSPLLHRTHSVKEVSMTFKHPVRAGVVVAVVCATLGIGLTARSAIAGSNVGAPLRQGSTGHTISVSGHGEVQVAPDMATLTVGVQSSSDTAQGALADAANKMTAVIAAIEAQGVPASHIQTTDLEIWYDSQRGAYVASHSVTASLDDVNHVGNVLDAAVGAGANNSWGVSFGLKNQSAARSQALQSAIADARTRANSIASALGVTISGVGSASEASVSVPQPVPVFAAAAAAPSAATPVQPGQLTVTADVNVTYTFG